MCCVQTRCTSSKSSQQETHHVGLYSLVPDITNNERYPAHIVNIAAEILLYVASVPACIFSSLSIGSATVGILHN